MVIPDYISKMLKSTQTLGWLAGVKDNTDFHLCRTCGVLKIDQEHIRILITPSLSPSLIRTIKEQPKISFTVVDAYTFESYQFKGIYIDSGALGIEEEDLKQKFMTGIKEVLVGMGFDYGDRFKKYSGLEGVAVTMRVQEIYEQTPRKGTGFKLKIKGS